MALGRVRSPLLKIGRDRARANLVIFAHRGKNHLSPLRTFDYPQARTNVGKSSNTVMRAMSAIKERFSVTLAPFTLESVLRKDQRYDKDPRCDCRRHSQHQTPLPTSR